MEPSDPMDTPPKNASDAVSDGSEDSRVQQDRFRVFLEEVADGFYETDLKGNFVYFNDALCTLFGYPRRELLLRNYSEFMDEENARLVYQSFNTVFQTGRGVTDMLWEIRRKDGERRMIELSAHLITDDRDRKIGFRGIARDVTEKHLAQQRLQRSERRAQQQSENSRLAEKRYRALLDFLPDPVAVFNLDSTVSYVNPAFEAVFGWTRRELEGRHIPFIPDYLKEETKRGIWRLFRERAVHGFETRRLTKDGRILDVILGAALFYEEDDQPSGQVVILRDVTRSKRVERANLALFRISTVLPRFRSLDERLEFIIREVQDLLNVEGASVILLDEEKEEFFFRVAAYDDTETGKRMREIRFPANRGVAGEVLRTGAPLIVHDTSKSPHFYQQVDEQSEYRTLTMLDVPIRTQDRIIGVLCAVNKKDGPFDQTDLQQLSTIASTVAFPIENAQINEELKRSYVEVQSLNRAKDRVIHHLSHELKTPVSVLAASLNLLKKELADRTNPKLERILDRSRRNLDRVLEIQYEIQDMLRDRDYRTHRLLSALLDECIDELEALLDGEEEREGIVGRLRQRLEDLFGPVESLPEAVEVHRFVEERLEQTVPHFAHRDLNVRTSFESTPPIRIPVDVMAKIVDSLLRNAVENTPDGGEVAVVVRQGSLGPELEINDTGVGITAEDQELLFETIFPSSESAIRSSRRPYDFNAAGKGFDLLRLKIFSERFNFRIHMQSRRCRFLPARTDRCPGGIRECRYIESPEECHTQGGTTMLVQFYSGPSTTPMVETS